MPEGINFVRERRKILTKLESKDHLWFQYSQWALGVVVVVMCICLGIRVFLGSRQQSLEDRQTELKRAILVQEDTERSYIIFVNKLKTLTDLFAQRQDKQAAIDFFSELFSDEVLIQEISYTADEKILRLSLRAPNIFIADQIFKTLNAPTVTSQYPNLSKSELKRSSEGTYDLSVTVVLASEETEPEE